MRPRPSARLAAAALAACALAAPAAAQQDFQQQIRQSQQRLEQIRAERQQLQQQMEALRTRVHDASAELDNVAQQVSTSADALKELEFQATALNERVTGVTTELLQTRDRLVERRAVLNQRLRSIYKRGPMHSIRVLLTAETFGELLNRYKYLHLIALYDRLLVREITQLEQELVARDRELRQSLVQLQTVRDERLDEFAQLQYLERQHENTLKEYRTRERSARSRLDQLQRDEARLANVIEDLEKKRLAEERRRAVAGGRVDEGTLSTRDMGNLNWPVQGRVVYRFGREQGPNGVVLRRNGIGIGATAGTPVQAVEAGRVMMAGPFEGYGPTVILSHGGGYYTLYHYLRAVNVQAGDAVQQGQTIGTVGGDQTPEGAHIEFQVRAPVDGGLPQPLDPLNWLQKQAGGG